jgi:hypothetical protein
MKPRLRLFERPDKVAPEFVYRHSGIRSEQVYRILPVAARGVHPFDESGVLCSDNPVEEGAGSAVAVGIFVLLGIDATCPFAAPFVEKETEVIRNIFGNPAIYVVSAPSATPFL